MLKEKSDSGVDKPGLAPAAAAGKHDLDPRWVQITAQVVQLLSELDKELMIASGWSQDDSVEKKQAADRAMRWRETTAQMMELLNQAGFAS